MSPDQETPHQERHPVGGRNVVMCSAQPLAKGYMAGMALRAWELARVLRPRHHVSLLAPDTSAWSAEGIRVEDLRSHVARKAVAQSDVLYVQGNHFQTAPWMIEAALDPSRMVVADLIDPFMFETAVLHAGGSAGVQRTIQEETLRAARLTLALADRFMCASDLQRDLWMGALASLGRLSPEGMKALPRPVDWMALVPFGMSSSAPSPRKGWSGKIPGVRPTDRVVVWYGGLWPWMDPMTVIKAVAGMKFPAFKLVVIGGHPPEATVEGMDQYEACERLAKHLGVYGKSIFFVDWVPYDLCQDYLVGAAAGVVVSHQTLEARYAFRTRAWDLLWAGVPLVATEGDALAELVRAHGLGEVVPHGDQGALVSAIRAVAAPARRRSLGTAIAKFRKYWTWEKVTAPWRAWCDAPEKTQDLPTRKALIKAWRLDRPARTYLLAKARYHWETGGARAVWDRATRLARQGR